MAEARNNNQRYVYCELCCVRNSPAIVAHLRDSYPGCKTPTLCGFNKKGEYRRDGITVFRSSEFTTCGSYGREEITGFWYMYCPDCHDNTERKHSPRVQDFRSRTDRQAFMVPTADYATLNGKNDFCEMCGVNIAHLVVSHLRTKHPGCTTPTLCGYDKQGIYHMGTPQQFRASRLTHCGSYGEEAYTGIWYMYCPNCRGNRLKISKEEDELRHLF